jgi:hypothetical protein
MAVLSAARPWQPSLNTIGRLPWVGRNPSQVEPALWRWIKGSMRVFANSAAPFCPHLAFTQISEDGTRIYFRKPMNVLFFSLVYSIDWYV